MIAAWQQVYDTWRSCHSWRHLDCRRLTAMTFFLVIAFIVAVAALAPRFGADSRGLRDHPWEQLRH
jgi:hypothetical protein